MAMTIEQYKQAGLQLLPQGRIWDKSCDGNLAEIMNGVAKMLARIDSTAEKITNESIPSNALILLRDFENFAGLPDCTVDVSSSISERKQALSKKLKMTGSLSKAQLIQQASEQGYDINIIERYPHHCLRNINYPIYPWHNWWIAFIEIKGAKARNATVIDEIKTLLTTRDDYSDLVCLLERYKPAHINLIYIDNEV